MKSWKIINMKLHQNTLKMSKFVIIFTLYFSNIFSSRFSFGRSTLRPLIVNAHRVNYSMFTHQAKWQFSVKHRQRLLDNRLTVAHSHRHYGMLIGRLLRGALKIRYLVLGGAVGGTVSLNRVSWIMWQAMTGV